MRPIKAGDKVNVLFDKNQPLKNPCIVMSVPQDTGDLWYFDDANKFVVGVNPNCSDFMCIEKLK